MAEVRHHANRNLRPRELPNGECRGLKHYFSFAHESLPTWWSMELRQRYPDALGAYENVEGKAEQALVVLPDAVVVLDADGGENRRVVYSEIVDFEPPAKEPVPQELRIILSSGVFRLPVLGRTGAVMDWLRFLQCAWREMR